jgi:N-acetylated-alpha-linked acidic dipeptidase
VAYLPPLCAFRVWFSYHSVYDNEYWMEKYGDPGFGRHVVSAKVLGLVLLRMADSLVIPLNVTQYATELTDYKNKYVPTCPLSL